jgi:hypothetical protein
MLVIKHFLKNILMHTSAMYREVLVLGDPGRGRWAVNFRLIISKFEAVTEGIFDGKLKIRIQRPRKHIITQFPELPRFPLFALILYLSFW